MAHVNGHRPLLKAIKIYSNYDGHGAICVQNATVTRSLITQMRYR